MGEMFALNQPSLFHGSKLPMERLSQDEVSPMVRALTRPLRAKIHNQTDFAHELFEGAAIRRQFLEVNHARPRVTPKQSEIARQSVESKRPSELIDYATATPFANGIFETALALEATHPLRTSLAANNQRLANRSQISPQVGIRLTQVAPMDCGLGFFRCEVG